MLEALKQKVYESNMELVNKGVVLYTWGNASQIDRATGYVVIKPSGIAYEVMKPEDMVVVDLDGNVVEGKWRPSSDTPTHLELYKAFPKIGGITHTHSTYATAMAQAGSIIPAVGTTHADYFYGDVPCTRSLTEQEVEEAYEKNTGLVIVETFAGRDDTILHTPGVLVNNHGPFTWGKDAAESVYHAVVLERVAEMYCITRSLQTGNTMPDYILRKHFLRKHGKNAYYGQK